jgi:NADPH-dependent glutamate synthase beta subunit-like oxidoreductase
MVKLTIDNKTAEVMDGITIMEAAASLGITIPSMCFVQGLSNHPSCMVCMVKDIDRDHMVPSCAMPVSEGMNIVTSSEEVKEVRKEALELLLSDHVGDCEAPCRLSCPAFMDIPLMNRLIASGNFNEALRIVRQEIAMPMVLGYICPAPCEKACKRKPIDQAVSVCMLKRSSAQLAEKEKFESPAVSYSNGKKVAIIGTGPAGLSSAFYLLRSGHACVLFDEHEKAGGPMQYDIPDDQLPKEILDAEVEFIRRMGAEFRMGVKVTREIFKVSIQSAFDAIILATGTTQSGQLETFGLQPVGDAVFIDKKNLTTSIPGVFACGNVIREQKMAVHSAANGKMAAKQVERYLGTNLSQGEPDKKSISVTGHLSEPERKEYLKESIAGPRAVPSGGILSGFTMEEAILEAKRCMHCDCRKPVSCKLRKYAGEYGANRKRFAGPDRKQLTKSMQHGLVVYEPEKCIRCGLCVEIAEKHGESIGLTFAGRGFDVHISVPFNKTMQEGLTIAAMDCVTACPTGALAIKTCEERNT